MPMRISGLMSGMDTETIISQLVEAKKTKVNKAIKAQKSLKYKQDAWKTLNTQIKKLHSKALSDMRFESSFIKKTTKVSNDKVVSVITGEGAMNSVQSLEVTELARSGYLTSGDLRKNDDSDKTLAREVKGSTLLRDLGYEGGSGGVIQVESAGETTSIRLSFDTTVDEFISQLKGAGVNASFDEANGRIHVVSKSSGVANDFQIYAANRDGLSALNALKMSYTSDNIKAKYTEILGSVDPTDPDAVAALCTQKTNERFNELKARRDNLLGEHQAVFDQLKTISSVWDGSGWSQAFQDALTEAEYSGGTVSSYEDYQNLTDGEKAKFESAVRDVLGDALDDESLSDEDKKKLKEIQSGWNNGVFQLNQMKASFNDDYTDLSDAEKNTIEGKIYGAANVLSKLDSLPTTRKQEAKDAVIEMNGIEYVSDKNTFKVNGLTLTVNMKTDTTGPVTITTQDDTDGIYDMVRNFFKEYNSLMNQMDKLYGAESAKEYEPLLDEEKEAMSDSDIEEWETKIKDSILRKDSVLGTFSSEMRRIMMEGVEVNGKKMYLFDFGINTMNYFSAPEFEKNAYHIDGDPDDAETANNADVLKSMIANDPDTVVSFFTQLSKNLYGKMSELMGPTETSSAMTVYDDKKMKEDYDDYTAKIKDLEKKLADYEDKWYAKFASMETALAKMQQNASAVTSLLGGGV